MRVVEKAPVYVCTRTRTRAHIPQVIDPSVTSAPYLISCPSSPGWQASQWP